MDVNYESRRVHNLGLQKKFILVIVPVCLFDHGSIKTFAKETGRGRDKDKMPINCH